MRVTIRLFAQLRERAGADALELDDVPDGSDVGALKGLLEARHPELGSLGSVRGVLGTSYVDDATPVEDGAEVSLLPPVSGGSGDSGGMPEDEALAAGLFELHADPLDPEAARRRVTHASCGAAVRTSDPSGESSPEAALPTCSKRPSGSNS